MTTRDVSSRLLGGVPLLDVVVTKGPISNGRHTSLAYIKLESPDFAQQAIDHVVRSQDGSHSHVVEVSNSDDFNEAKALTSGSRSSSSDVSKLGVGDAKSIFELEPGLV